MGLGLATPTPTPTPTPNPNPDPDPDPTPTPNPSPKPKQEGGLRNRSLQLAGLLLDSSVMLPRRANDTRPPPRGELALTLTRTLTLPLT